ncbi:hypothetical protein SDA22_10245 [Legionella pneumophila serogroup 1]|uniref:hypothetical protein n=1 Tax=Legionella pneumophila TaxID=446 RepID=UPI00077071D1|nr:hypothetical protein [Legionella pneumophila]HAT8851656.1 hypothetical protein [Legionella pneumophila subsp. pneumophila]PYB44297.1 hypothetical protein DM454_08965 [Legionella pneumophila]PYB51498.1 hypothetical protein DM456_08015 [Legionella pneumophila]PYB62859.1 hypothetical protein DM455_09490 [Legionella pneumophila]QIB25611.1 hypothetical protein GCO85_14880 [Legionella pneumophila]
MQINGLRKWYRLVIMVSIFGLTGCPAVQETPTQTAATPPTGANAANQNNTQVANTGNNGAVATPAPPAPPAATIEITTCINV